MYHRSIKGLINNMYHHQIERSKKRGHRPPKYDRIELRERVLSQPNFKKLYNDRVSSGYNKDLSPSCDRYNEEGDYDMKPYCLSRMRIITAGENRRKYHEDRKNRVNNKGRKPVICMDKEGNFIEEFDSIIDASIATGAHQGHIVQVCKGVPKYKTAGGFKRKYI